MNGRALETAMWCSSWGQGHVNFLLPTSSPEALGLLCWWEVKACPPARGGMPYSQSCGLLVGADGWKLPVALFIWSS